MIQTKLAQSKQIIYSKVVECGPDHASHAWLSIGLYGNSPYADLLCNLVGEYENENLPVVLSSEDFSLATNTNAGRDGNVKLAREYSVELIVTLTE